MSISKYLIDFSLTTCALLACATWHQAAAQPPPANHSLSSSPQISTMEEKGAEETVRKDVSYRIGPGDVLDIRVDKHPELSREQVRVDNNGTIRMPRISAELKAACVTEVGLAEAIKKQYLSFLRNPGVEVFVKEYNSQPVAVIGAVNTPGRFQLQRPVRLLELLTYVNGPSLAAGQHVHVVHTGAAIACDVMSDTPVAENGFAAYRLESTLRADDQSNPYLRPGDIVRIPDAAQVFILGNVKEPQAIALREPITLTRAIAMAKGVLPGSDTNKVRIIRQQEGLTKPLEIVVNLSAINKRQADDILLQPNDMVEVPGVGGGKKILRGIMQTLIPSLLQSPISVIR